MRSRKVNLLAFHRVVAMQPTPSWGVSFLAQTLKYPVHLSAGFFSNCLPPICTHEQCTRAQDVCHCLQGTP